MGQCKETEKVAKEARLANDSDKLDDRKATRDDKAYPLEGEGQ